MAAEFLEMLTQKEARVFHFKISKNQLKKVKRTKKRIFFNEKMCFSVRIRVKSEL